MRERHRRGGRHFRGGGRARRDWRVGDWAAAKPEGAAVPDRAAAERGLDAHVRRRPARRARRGRADPRRFAKGMAAIYGGAVAMPNRGTVRELLLNYVDALYRAE